MTIVLALLMGILAAWLVNYLADTLPKHRRLAWPACKKCDAPFSWGRYLAFSPCAACGQARSRRSFAVFFLLAALSIFLMLFPPARLGYWLSMLLLAYFSLIIVIDIEERLILHVVTGFGAFLGLGIGIYLHGWLATLIGGAAGLLIMLALYLMGTVFARIKAKRAGSDDGEEALGFGDVTLSGVLGLVLGWPVAWMGLIGGILLAGIFSLFFILFLLASRRFQAFSLYIPYGPFLILGSIIYLLWRGL